MFTDYNFLYVEDDPMSRQALDVILTRVIKAGNVWIFEDSYNFQERVKALPERPDVILLDIHVPPHDGFEMLRMLREELGFSDTRIIALTASVMNEEVMMLKNSGFDGGIGKPINVASFPKVMERIINGEEVWHITDL